MNRKFLVFISALFSCCLLHAEEKDTLRVVDVEEVVVVSSPKNNSKMREQPMGVTLLSRNRMEEMGVSDVKKLSAVVPNMFIPDYGSRLTSAIYIRGVGSRINTPSVGLYVDNIPYIDKSAFDFNYSDVDRIDVLRGPQGTLYGKNAMGGMINIATKSPFAYQGTDVKLGVASYGTYHASLTHYHRTSDRFAFSAGGFYDKAGGFFENVATGHEKVDDGRQAGGRIKAIWLPADSWKVTASVNYEYLNQGGYPYGVYDKGTNDIAPVNYNQPSGYRRDLLNVGVNVEHQGRNFIFTAVTGYQWLKDDMMLDQDFSPASVYTLEQKQRINTISEELMFKSNGKRRWEWVSGLFAYYQQLRTDAPVTFMEDGMGMLSSMLSSVIPSRIEVAMGPTMQMHILPSLSLTDKEMRIKGDFSSPTANIALYHQSTIHRFLGIKRLSLVAGLRLDYERMNLDYDSGTSLRYTVGINGAMKANGVTIREIQMMKPTAMEVESQYRGTLDKDFFHVVPKVALQFDLDSRKSNVYATVSSGFRSGGYNVQMFSDLLQTSLRNAMMSHTKAEVLAAVPPAYKDMVAGYFPDGGQDPEARDAVEYKPETTLNYEIGTHLNLMDNRLQLDAVGFFMNTRDQQISRFAESGLGRVTVNAGRSHSKGVEASAAFVVSKAFSLGASYGFTHATFKEYETNTKVNGVLQSVSYTGNYVPFVPRHTLSVSGTYTKSLRPTNFIDKIVLHADFNGAGRIYWTEQNDMSQPFYGTLGARVGLHHRRHSLECWIRNVTNAKYTAFCFESIGTSFAQQGRPLQFGADLRLRF